MKILAIKIVLLVYSKQLKLLIVGILSLLIAVITINQLYVINNALRNETVGMLIHVYKNVLRIVINVE